MPLINFYLGNRLKSRCNTPMIDFGSANGILTINLEKLAANYRVFQNKVGTNCDVAGVIKADAYGLGLKQVSDQLKKLGCPLFLVATLDEALELREYDSDTPIAVLGGLMNKTESTYVEHHITPILNTPIDIKNWNDYAAQQHKNLKAILHCDTAMNRLGLSTQETKDFVQNRDLFNNIDITMVMSHFACADELDHPLTTQQAERFDTVAQSFPNAQKSLANSSGLFRNPQYHYDMVRPGYSLYGGNPTPETTNPMQNVVTLHSRILQIRECKKGQSIGYGATHEFNKDTRTATLALGYADGFLRSNSAKAVVYYEGQPCPVLGRVSMDLVSIDISHIKEKQPQQGEAIEILGDHQTVDDLANSAGTIGYEILTSLGKRYKRRYI